MRSDITCANDFNASMASLIWSIFMSRVRYVAPLSFLVLFACNATAADQYRLVVSPTTEFIALPGEEIRLTVTAQVLRDGKGTAWQNQGGMKIGIDKSLEMADGAFTGVVEPVQTTAGTGTLEFKFKVRDAGGLCESLCFHLLQKEPLSLQNVLAVNVVSVLVLSKDEQASLAQKFGDRNPKQFQDDVEKKVAEIVADANADTRRAKLTQLANFIKTKVVPGRNAGFEKVNSAQKELLTAIAKGERMTSAADLPAVARLRQAVVFDAADHLKKTETLIDQTRPLIADLNNKSEAQLKRAVGLIAAANSAYARELVKAFGDKPDFVKLIGTSLTIGVVRKGDDFTGAPLSELSKGGKPVACELVVRYDIRDLRKPALTNVLQQIGRLVGKRSPKSDSLAALSKQALAAHNLGYSLDRLFDHIHSLPSAMDMTNNAVLERLKDSLDGIYEGIKGAIPK
jgi:hypothetical protein